MQYLHTQIIDFSHGRLNCTTVFIDQSWRAKIGDYGLPNFRVKDYNENINNDFGYI